jgi:hypothetical protein
VSGSTKRRKKREDEMAVRKNNVGGSCCYCYCMWPMFVAVVGGRFIGFQNLRENFSFLLRLVSHSLLYYFVCLKIKDSFFFIFPFTLACFGLQIAIKILSLLNENI